MYKNRKYFAIGTSVLLIMLLCFDYFYLKSFNFLTFFIFTIILPSSLYSFASAAIIVGFQNKRNSWISMIISSLFFVLCIGGFLLFFLRDNVVRSIIENTKKIIGESSELTISNINVNFHFSSFLMLGLVVLSITKIFQIIFFKAKKELS